MQYTISDLAAEFDVTTRTIRFYEEKGLLTPKRQGTKRLFTPADRVKLQLILRGKRLGLTLDESKHIIDMYNPKGSNQKQLNALISSIRSKRSQLQAQLIELQNLVTDLDEAEQNCLAELENLSVN